MFGYTQTSTVKCDGLVGWTPTVGVFVYKREEKMYHVRPVLEKLNFPSSLIHQQLNLSEFKFFPQMPEAASFFFSFFFNDERFFLFLLKTLREANFSLASLRMF